MKEPTFEHKCEQTAYEALKADVPDLGQETYWNKYSPFRQQLACLELLRHAKKIAPILNRLISARRHAASGKTSLQGRPGNNPR